MFRRYFFPVVTFALIISTGILASAQTLQLQGHVVMKQADGTKAPASNVAIDVYRTDVAGKYATKTDKKGHFIFAGVPMLGTYIIAASREGAQPAWIANVRAGENDYEIELSPGDGKRFTADEIKTLIAQSKGPAAAGVVKESSEDKARREEIERENAEIAARNEKVANSNEVVARTFKAGNEAYAAKNYDEAIKQYAEGLAADPEQPALLINQARAQMSRGVSRYNAAILSKDEAATPAAMDAAKADLRAAAGAVNKAVAMLKAMPAPSESGELTNYNNNKLAAMTVNAEAMRLFVTKVDSTQGDAGLAAFKDYIAAETDPVKKAKAQLDAAQMLLDSGSVDKAYSEFQGIVTAEPNNPEANLGAGLSLFASGDKAKYQDAANFLQHYVDVAPDTHKFKADAKAILAELKSTEKVVPEKTPTTRRRRP